MNNYYSLNQIYEQLRKKIIKYVFIIKSKVKKIINIFTKLIYKQFLNLNNVSTNNNNRGAYIDSCHHHCGNWNTMHNGNWTQATAHYQFYINKVINKDDKIYIWNQNHSYPCSSCCN